MSITKGYKFGKRKSPIAFSEEHKKNISKNSSRFWLGKKRSEETKKKISESKKKNPTRYWLGKKLSEETKRKIHKFKKGNKPWNFGLRKETDERVRSNGLAIGLVLEGKKQSEELKIKRGAYNKEEKAHHWLGDNVGYAGIHQWIRRVLGKAKEHTCRCGKQARHWANLNNHIYIRKKEDFEAMCVKCHSIYDHKMRIFI